MKLLILVAIVICAFAQCQYQARGQKTGVQSVFSMTLPKNDDVSRPQNEIITLISDVMFFVVNHLKKLKDFTIEHKWTKFAEYISHAIAFLDSRSQDETAKDEDSGSTPEPQRYRRYRHATRHDG